MWAANHTCQNWLPNQVPERWTVSSPQYPATYWVSTWTESHLPTLNCGYQSCGNEEPQGGQFWRTNMEHISNQRAWPPTDKSFLSIGSTHTSSDPGEAWDGENLFPNQLIPNGCPQKFAVQHCPHLPAWMRDTECAHSRVDNPTLTWAFHSSLEPQKSEAHTMQISLPPVECCPSVEAEPLLYQQTLPASK